MMTIDILMHRNKSVRQNCSVKTPNGLAMQKKIPVDRIQRNAPYATFEGLKKK